MLRLADDHVIISAVGCMSTHDMFLSGFLLVDRFSWTSSSMEEESSDHWMACVIFSSSFLIGIIAASSDGPPGSLGG